MLPLSLDRVSACCNRPSTSVPVLTSLFWFLDRARVLFEVLAVFTVSDVPLPV